MTNVLAAAGRPVIILFGLAVAGGCGSGPASPADELEGGVLATFDVSGQTFRVWVTNPATAAAILALRDGEAEASIPNGVIRRGAGAARHNAPWGWHLDPEDVEMADLTVEVCDGSPSYVQEELDEYLRVGRYCPWGARLISVDDRR